MTTKKPTASDIARRNSAKSPWRTYKPGWLKSNPWAPKREARK